jgi:hypothetical protein
MVCAFCGKNGEPLPVCEGEKRFHLDCYVRYKRRPPPSLSPKLDPA